MKEVLGSAIAIEILFGIPLWVGVIITILDTFLILLINICGQRKLEALFSLFIIVMFICFLINLIVIKPNVGDIALGLIIPKIPFYAVRQALALVGSIIMPHNLYLHSSLIKNRDINRNNKVEVNDSLLYFKLELGFSLFFSFFINLIVVSTFAFFSNSGTSVDLKNAGDALENTFQKNGKYIWALGLFASGQSSTLTGTLTGQFVMQVSFYKLFFKFFIFYKGFLDIKVSQFWRSLLTRSLAVVPSIFVVFLDNPTVVNENLNILQAIQLPFAILPLLKFSYSKFLSFNIVNLIIQI